MSLQWVEVKQRGHQAVSNISCGSLPQVTRRVATGLVQIFKMKEELNKIVESWE